MRQIARGVPPNGPIPRGGAGSLSDSVGEWRRRLTIMALSNFMLWASLLVLIPLLACADYMPNPGLYQLSVLFLGCVMVANILMLRGHPRLYLPLLVLAMAFVPGYFLKMPSLVAVFSSEDATIIETWDPKVFATLARVSRPENMVKAWYLTLAAYLGLSAAVAICHYMKTTPRSFGAPVRKPLLGSMYFWLMLAGMTACVLYPISAYFGLGFMSQEQTRLPFALTGIVNYGRFSITYIFATIALSAYLTGNARWTLVGVSLLTLNTFFIALTSGSRAGFVMIAIFMVITGTIYNRLNRRTIFLVTIMILASAALHPLISDYRDMVAEQGSVRNIPALISNTYQSVGGGGQHNLFELVYQRVYTLFDRVQGFQGLLFFSTEDFEFNLSRTYLVFTEPESFGISRHLTDNLMNYGGLSGGKVHGAAAGMPGSLYYLFGPAGIFLGVFSWAMLLQWTYARVMSKKWHTLPAILCYLIFYGMQYFSEGNLNLIIKDQLAMIPFFFLLEVLCLRTGPSVDNGLLSQRAMRAHP